MPAAFGSPIPPEARAYAAELTRWFREGGGPPPEPPVDPLKPYLDYFGSLKEPICVRMEPWMVELTKEVAKQYRLPYQQVIREWVRDGLRRVIREGTGSGAPPPAVVADRVRSSDRTGRVR